MLALSVVLHSFLHSLSRKIRLSQIIVSQYRYMIEKSIQEFKINLQHFIICMYLSINIITIEFRSNYDILMFRVSFFYKAFEELTCPCSDYVKCSSLRSNISQFCGCRNVLIPNTFCSIRSSNDNNNMLDFEVNRVFIIGSC